MSEFINIRLKLPKKFNYDLTMFLAKLKRDNSVKESKSKAELIVECAIIGLKEKSK
jgi:hypothetical protein